VELGSTRLTHLLIHRDVTTRMATGFTSLTRHLAGIKANVQFITEENITDLGSQNASRSPKAITAAKIRCIPEV
jgi:hypothetical protein